MKSNSILLPVEKQQVVFLIFFIIQPYFN